MNISIFSHLIKFIDSCKNINYNQSIDTILQNIKVSEKTPLEWAISYELLDETQYLLENGADPNQDTEDGIPLLSKACIKNNVNLIHILVKKGADVKKIDRNGKKAIDYTNNKNIEKYLLYKGV